MTQRPLSPHLGIYRWLWTNTLSILHRITGFSLSIGSILFVVWLWAAAYSPDFYADLHAFLGSPLGLVMLFGWSAAFYYHLFNGIRHLTWDAGVGVEIHTATRYGKIVLALTIAFTALTWFCVFSK